MKRRLALALFALAFALCAAPAAALCGERDHYLATIERGQIEPSSWWAGWRFAREADAYDSLYSSYGAGQISAPLGALRSLVQHMGPDSPNNIYEDTRVRIEFDARGRPDHLVRHDIFGELEHQVLLERDASGHVVRAMEWLGDHHAAAESAEYAYDEFGRLLQIAAWARTPLSTPPGGPMVEALRTKIAYEPQRAIETLWLSELVCGRRSHELDREGRVVASFKLHEDGTRELLARYEYMSGSDGTRRCETWARGTHFSELEVWDEAGDRVQRESYDERGRCTSRGVLLKCGREWTQLRWRFEFSGESESPSAVEEHQIVRLLPDHRFIRSSHRKYGGALSPGELQGERRYEYLDDARGNWIRRETSECPEGGVWALREVHLRDIEYR